MRWIRVLMITISALAALQLGERVQTAHAVDCPYTPGVSTSERKAILNALRKPIVRELGQGVRFVIERLSVCRGWAFVEATPQSSTGEAVDWSISSYADAVKHDACGGYVHALLVRRSGQWRVRHYQICATDVPYVSWAKEFGAPTQLFPYSE
ncbi:MAG: hypothetical protein QNJ62_12040 [Methyloceanibacter sp.]|nr:hypothetical protein [Methyloceanibacter sp.]